MKRTHSRPELTVLTDPVPTGASLLPELARGAVRRLRYTLGERPFSSDPVYRGHFAVTRSLVEGLRQVGADFNYNPSRIAQVADTVVVLAGVRTVRQAIALKRAGRIRRLLVGPNIVIFSSDHDALLAAPEIDCVITPAAIVGEHYVEQCPSLAGRMIAWPAGVDAAYWSPDPAIRRRQVLFFEKQNKGPVGPIAPYVNHVRAFGYEVEILRYGEYRHDDYRECLRRSALMVGFVTDESQGIAWTEAWACDVPTLIWRNTTHTHLGRTYRCSTAPYLTDSTGAFFDDLADFIRQFTLWADHGLPLQPRDWVLENMTDAVCARRLLDHALGC